jgi:heat shock protein HslJ
MLTASTWQWIGLTDPLQQVEIASPEKYTLTFTADGSVQIQADCNQGTASYTAAEDGSLSIEPGIFTLVACPPESRGEEFIQKLGFAAIHFFQDGNLFIDLMADGGTLEFSPQAADDQADGGVTATEVISFVPSEIPTETQSGSCFTNAIGLGREDAYRCTVGNAIFDPCFVVDDAPTVVCDANPASGETGFVLELTEPLPDPDVGQQLPQPWLVELADGQVCGLLTGTVVGVGERIAPYGCPDRTYLFEDFQQGTVWLAEKAVIGPNDDGYFIEQSEMVPISRIWQ